MLRHPLVLALTLAIASAVPTSAAVSPDADSPSEGRKVAALALTDPEDFIRRSEPKFLAEVGGPEQLRARLAEFKAAGPELKSDGERVYRYADEVIYQRTGRYAGIPSARLEVVLHRITGKVIFFSFQKVEPKPAGLRTDYRPKVRLKLPFGDPPPGAGWTALWAGPTLVDNHHSSRDASFAIDIAPRRIMMMDALPRASETMCWGLPILASASGRVVKVVDGNADHQERAKKNPGTGFGNHVIIDHGNSEFTLYAHLRNGSTAVAEGAKVEAGAKVGACGNSGGSNAPHLHFQLMDHADVSKANGLPPRFYDYFSPVRYVPEGTILRGDFVLPGFATEAFIRAR